MWRYTDTKVSHLLLPGWNRSALKSPSSRPLAPLQYCRYLHKFNGEKHTMGNEHTAQQGEENKSVTADVEARDILHGFSV